MNLEAILGPASQRRLFDERSRPDFREVYGRLSGAAVGLDVALTRIRLSSLDLGANELGRIRRLRLLLAEVNSMALDNEARAVAHRAHRRVAFENLIDLLARQVIEVRAAPLAGWSPDFSVFSGEDGPAAVLLGCHWFEHPFPHRGPALASLLGREEATLAHRRFEDAWASGHEIGPALLGVLGRPEARPLAVAEASPSLR